MNSHQKKFISIIEALASSSGVRAKTLFRDFAAMAALELSSAVDLRTRDLRRAELASLRSRYTAAQLEQMSALLSCAIESLQAEMHDCLGQIYMQLNIGNEDRGQFFTPYEVAHLLAHINLGGSDKIIARRGYVTMDEPAAGAGCMAIVFASVLSERGHNYQQSMHARLTDIDMTAVHMSYVQLSLLYIPALIVHGDALRPRPGDGHWYTPAHILDGWGHRLNQDQPMLATTA